MMEFFAVLGWAFFMLMAIILFFDHGYWKKLAEQKENAKELWHEQAVAWSEELATLRGEVKNKDNAILDLRVEIDRLTPKRNARGKFVGRHEEL